MDNLVTISEVRCVKCKNKGVYLRGEKFKINDMEFKTIVTGIKAAISKALDFIKENSFVLVILAIFILFHPFFEKAASTLIVHTFLCQLQKSLLSDVVLFLLSLVVIIRCILLRRKNYYLSSKSVLLSLLSFFVIVYYRVSNLTWDFQPTYLFESVKYVDVIILYFLSNLVISFCYRKKVYSCTSDDGFCFDNPIENLADDTLNRKCFAENLAKKIVNTSSTKSSFAIGITSEWGNGKTSFLNLIKSYLPNENRVIIQFNPWLNNDETSVIMSFFDELSNKLRKYNKELSDDILKYAEILSSIDNNGFTVANKISEIIFNQKNDLLSQFIRINNAINSAGIQIVIFVDDLDRLYEKEVVEILRLIRNSANFSNSVFVVAYDRSYVITAIKKANEHKPNRFLEKIFQLEFTLPVYENKLVVDYLRKQIRLHLTNSDQAEFDELLEEKFTMFDVNIFKYDLIKNLRDVNRLVNSFLVSYEHLKGEIMLLDLLNLEMLRIKYLGVYNLFANDYNSFLTTKEALNGDGKGQSMLLAEVKKGKDDIKEKSILTRHYDNNNGLYDMYFNLTGNKSILEDYLETHFAEVGINETDIEDVLIYVFAVFPSFSIHTQKQTSHLSIRNPVSIGRYFFNTLLNSNLSEVDFSNSRLSSYGEFIGKIKEWVDNGLMYDVALRLERINFYSNKDDFEKVVRAIFYFAALERPHEKGYVGFDGSNLYNKISAINTLSLYQNKQDLKRFIMDVFKSQEPPYDFSSAFIHHVMEKTSNIHSWGFILSIEELVDLKCWQFKQYSSITMTFDKNTIFLYDACKYKLWENKTGSDSYTQVKYLPDNAKAIFIECAERLIESFIKNIIAKSRSFSMDDEPLSFTINNIAKEVWGDWSKFEEFIGSFDDEKVKGLYEFKRLYEKTKADDYKYVEFEFNDIDLTDAILFPN